MAQPAPSTEGPMTVSRLMELSRNLEPQLDELDYENFDALLQYFLDIREISRFDLRLGAELSGKIVQAFKDHGFAVNAFTGYAKYAFDPEDREIYARRLIGGALGMIEESEMVNEWFPALVVDWQQKFGA